MENHLRNALLFVTLLCGLSIAGSKDTSGVWKVLPDTSATVSGVVDTTALQIKSDTLPTPARATAPDTLTKQLGASNLKLVKRNYNSRQQVLLASGMMIFVITIMTAAQQWNPR